MARDSWLNWTLATAGLAGAGFAAGLHRWVWSLFWITTLVWLGLCYGGARNATGAELLIWWALALGAPSFVGFALRLVEGVILAVLGSGSTNSDA